MKTFTLSGSTLTQVCDEAVALGQCNYFTAGIYGENAYILTRVCDGSRTLMGSIFDVDTCTASEPAFTITDVENYSHIGMTVSEDSNSVKMAIQMSNQVLGVKQV